MELSDKIYIFEGLLSAPAVRSDTETKLHLNYMKKIYTTILLALCVMSAAAQSPRAVIKSIMEGDAEKAIERLEKISLKTRNEMPEMCILAEAALLSMEHQNNESKLRSYDMLTTHIKQISESENIEKTLKGDDITLQDIIAMIEQQSLNAVLEIDTESTYRSYIALAEKGNHSNIKPVLCKLEEKIFEGVMGERSVEACNKFLAEFPESKHRAEVEAHRANIRYDEAIASTDEDVMELFIADYPKHERVGDVATRLMEQRYQRIVLSEKLDDMKWFVDRYPNHHEIESLKQMMANIEYPTLKDSREALEAFVEYYPNVRQVGEANSRIAIFQIIDRADIGEIFRYIKKHGYDRNYTRMQRSIAQKHGYIILTQDINAVSLVRFRTIEGKVGYLNHDGRVVVEPKYDLKSYAGLGISSRHATDVFECRADRGMAMVFLENRSGAINGSGQLVIPAEYTNIAFLDSEIICVKPSTEGEEQTRGMVKCAVYDYKGAKVADERVYSTSPGAATSNNWDTSWFTANVSIKDTQDEWEKSIYVEGKCVGSIYGGLHYITPHYRWFQTQNDEKINVISRTGNITTLNFLSYELTVIYNNIIIAESISSGNRCVIDLDKQAIISKDKFRNMWAMNEGVILVQYLDNSFGFVDSNFEPCIKQSYDRAFSFSCGTAAVIKGTQAYLIDREGNKISTIYDDIAPLAGYKGLYKVMLNNKCGIIDANNDIIVEIEHEPIKQSHYSSEKLSSITCNNGVIEWSDGSKSLIFSK